MELFYFYENHISRKSKASVMHTFISKACSLMIAFLLFGVSISHANVESSFQYQALGYEEVGEWVPIGSDPGSVCDAYAQVWGWNQNGHSAQLFQDKPGLWRCQRFFEGQLEPTHYTRIRGVCQISPEPILTGSDWSHPYWSEEYGVCHCNQFGQKAFDYTVEWCTGEPKKCEAPTEYNYSTGKCEAKCDIGVPWDAKDGCADPEKAKSCATQSQHPIDFIEGAKYRKEKVLSVASQFPINVYLSYNNHENFEKTAKGMRRFSTANDSGQYVAYSADPKEPHLVNYYGASTDWYTPNQYFGDYLRYWRHNYDEALLIETSGEFKWLRSDGQDIRFDINGKSAVYPGILLTAIDSNTYGFSGWKIANNNGISKIFDDEGKFRRLEKNQSIYHELTYNANSQLIRVSHSLGGHIDFNYEDLPIYTRYIGGSAFGNRPHLDHLQDHAGRHVDISWAPVKRGERLHYVVTRYTRPYATTAQTARDFSYQNEQWPVALTDIFDVSDIATHTRKLYAHFEYDNEGRAVLSELANGVDRVEVDYVDDLTRRVTNALGKDSTYTFVESNGVKRLQSVVGEATVNCAESNTSFVYTNDGNIDTKTQNGQVTKYDYNSRGLRTRTTEAFGTPLARSVETIWHPDFNLPATIIEPHRTIQFDYHPNGQLRQRQITDMVTP